MGEGSSDLGLRFPIQALADSWNIELVLTAPDLDRLGGELLRGPIESRLRRVLELGGEYDVVFVHRDSDNAGVEARRTEVEGAVAAVYEAAGCVPIIPVKMTEAWLLLDEPAIRHVAGNPRGRVDLNLPTHREVERLADPKALLKEKLALASEQTGRRLLSVKKRFDQNRQQLLERLDVDGPVRQLSAWQEFVQRMEATLKP